jgi:adenosine 3'-phospho 5'-phosphosulfate transporter B2
MIVGRCLKGTRYDGGQYLEAGVITGGVFVFSYFGGGGGGGGGGDHVSDSTGGDHGGTSTLGILLLLAYILSDAFTSQWQSSIYQNYGRQNCDQYQMMLGVNLYAIAFTTLGLAVSGDIPVVLEFLKANPVCLQYNVITAITSATGQLFIFYTIKEFGPLVFTVIMTTRQMLSICLSCVIFGHSVDKRGMVGAGIVFGTIGRKVYKDFKKQRGRDV